MNQSLELAGEYVPDTLLTSQQEGFCRTYVDSNSAAQAYRFNFDCSGMPGKQIWERASVMKRNPLVAKRIQDLQRELALESIVTARQLLQDFVDIARADPNDLIRHEHRACRHCYGVDHLYQWQSGEWANAAAHAIEQGLTAPSAEGGFGFDPQLSPAPHCPHCYGQGINAVIIADTDKLSGPARKLYKGVKKTKLGIEILMHDQQAARESIAKMLGAFKDGSERSLSPAEPAKAISKDATPDDAQKAYLKMVS